MPELPEVETIVRDIRPALLGRRIERVALSHDDVLRGVTRRRLLRGLTGATVRDVFRRAKHAVIDFGDRRLVVQPGMTGSLIVHRPAARRRRSGDTPCFGPRWTTAASWSIDDVRRLGTLLLLDRARLGPVHRGDRTRAAGAGSSRPEQFGVGAGRGRGRR